MKSYVGSAADDGHWDKELICNHPSVRPTRSLQFTINVNIALWPQCKVQTLWKIQSLSFPFLTFGHFFQACKLLAKSSGSNPTSRVIPARQAFVRSQLCGSGFQSQLRNLCSKAMQSTFWPVNARGKQASEGCWKNEQYTQRGGAKKSSTRRKEVGAVGAGGQMVNCTTKGFHRHARRSARTLSERKFSLDWKQRLC